MLRALKIGAKRAILGLAIVFVFAWLLDGSQTFQNCVQGEQGQATQHDFKNDISSLSFPINIYRNCVGDIFHRHHNEIIAAFTVLLAIVTIFLWWATRDLVRGAEDAARRQLRAYVFTGEVRLNADPAKGLMAIVQLKNGGLTPAYDTEVLHSAKTIWAKEIKSFPDPKRTQRTSKIDVGQGSIIQTEILLDEILNPRGQEALRNGDLELFVWGVISYRDIFKRKQTTRFRFVMGGRHRWPADNRFLVCQDGNKAT